MILEVKEVVMILYSKPLTTVLPEITKMKKLTDLICNIGMKKKCEDDLIIMFMSYIIIFSHFMNSQNML